MWKISILSLLICVLLLLAYYFGGITDLYAFKIMLYTFGGICLLSTCYGIYKLNKGKEKIQPKLGEQQ
jgi:hypothetical protein